MIDIDQWMKQYQNIVEGLFGSRIAFIGLQGSYGRSEAHESSDIDIVLILDTVSLADLKQYRHAIEALPKRPPVCGFVSGKEEIRNWCRAELFQFCHDTISYYGDLNATIPALTDADAQDAVLTGACSLYHTCSHNYLHARDMETLENLYKSAVYVLQAKHYCNSGNYVRSHTELREVLEGTDLTILQYAERIKASDRSQTALERYSEQMLRWTQQLIGGKAKHTE